MSLGTILHFYFKYNNGQQVSGFFHGERNCGEKKKINPIIV